MKLRRQNWGIRWRCFIASIVVLPISLSGCQGIPKDALKLSPETLNNRMLQTRRFDGITEEDMLAASAGVIQDLEFNIDESETKLGVIVGSKERSAVETGQVIGSIVAALFGASVAIDKNQRLRISLVVRPVKYENEMNHFVRVTFQRTVWNTQGHITRIEPLDDPEMYQEFFDKLSTAVFLEAQEI